MDSSKKSGKKSAKDKKEKKDKTDKQNKKGKKEKIEKAQTGKKNLSRKKQRVSLDAAVEDDELVALPQDTGPPDAEIAASSRDNVEGDFLSPSVAQTEEVPFEDERPAEPMLGQQEPEQVVQGELEVMRELVQALLVEAGGEAPLRALEQKIGEALGPEVLSSFVLDRQFNKVYLPGTQICHILESPSFNAAAAEESYWRLGQELLAAGLDFDSEEHFKTMFADLLKKRDEVREATSQGHITVSGNGLELQPLGSMDDKERSLYNAVLSAFTTMQQRQSWIPMSHVLDDVDVRRWRFAVPKGRRFWEWLDERFGQDLEMVTNGTEMLLHFAGYESRLRETAVARAEALEHEFVSAVFDELTKGGRSHSRHRYALPISELCNNPAITHLKFPQESVRRALERRPETFEVIRTTRTELSVRLQPGASPPSRSAQPMREVDDDAAPQSLAEARALELRRARVGDMPRKRSRLLTMPQAGTSGTTAAGSQAAGPGARPVVDRKSTQQSRYQGLPPLPSGWIRRTSRSTGRLYYVNEKTGKSQFELPTQPAIAAPDRVTSSPEICLD